MQAGRLLIGIRKARGRGEQDLWWLRQPLASSSALLLGEEGGLCLLLMWLRTPHSIPLCSSKEKQWGNLGFQAFAQEVWCSQVALELLEGREWEWAGCHCCP